jgi:hypothetical protein
MHQYVVVVQSPEGNILGIYGPFNDDRKAGEWIDQKVAPHLVEFAIIYPLLSPETE